MGKGLKKKKERKKGISRKGQGKKDEQIGKMEVSRTCDGVKTEHNGMEKDSEMKNLF